MSDYIHYSPWADASQSLQGAGQGVASAILQAPNLALHAAQMRMLAQEQQAHAGLYGAEAGLANARTGLVTTQDANLKSDHAALIETGNALAEIAAGGGQASVDQFRRAFVGIAQKNPGALANFFVHLAPYVGAHTPDNENQPMDMAMMLGRKDYGADKLVGEGQTLLGPDRQPVGYGIVKTNPGQQVNVPTQPAVGPAGGQPFAGAPAIQNQNIPPQHLGGLWNSAYNKMTSILAPLMTPEAKTLTDQIVGSMKGSLVPAGAVPVQAPSMNGPQPLAIPQAANSPTNPTATALRFRRNPVTQQMELVP